MKSQTSNPSRWGRLLCGLARGAFTLFIAALFSVGTASAGLVLEVKPADYNTNTLQWPIASGSLAGDYFACAPSWPVSVTSKIYTNNGLGYTAVDFTAANTILGGPLCPASLGGASPKTIEAWVFRPSTIGGDSGMILDLSREDFGTPNRQFAFSSSQWGGGGGRALHTTGPGSTIQTWNTSSAARGNNWVHLVASYDGSNLNLYVNGVLDKTVAYTYDTETGGSIAIGGFRYGFEGTPHSVGSFDNWTAWRGYMGSIRVYDEARSAGQIAADYALGVNYGEVGTGLPDYTITATVTGGHGTIDPAGAVLVTQGTSKTFLFLPDSGYMVDTVTVDGSPVVLPYPGTSYTFSNVAADHTIDVTYKADPNADILFSLNTDALSAIADGERITSWSTAVPVGASMPAFSTFNNGLPLLGPIVETIDGVKWEQNTRANYDDTVSPTIHMRQDGFALGGSYSSPIPVNGASVVTVVRPVRKPISDGWNSIVDVFYQKLVLGIRNDNGNIIVWRNGSLFTGPAIPDGQKTILSLVVETNGQFKVYANGLEVMSTTTTSDMSALVPGSADHEKTIRVGRGWDLWTVFNGNIADTIMFKSAISDTARTALEASLATKFGMAASSFTITASAGSHGSIAPTGSVTVAQGANQTFNFTADVGYLPDQVTIDGGTPVPADASYTFNDVQADHTIAVTFKVDPTYDPTRLFSLNANNLGADGSPILSWDGFAKIQNPTVQVIGTNKWESNVRSNDDPTRNDGFLIGSYTTSIPVSGVTMVTVVKPARSTISDGWNSVVDIMYDKLTLGIKNNTGQIVVWRNRTLDTSVETIPDGRATVLSMTVQTDGSYEVWANGLSILTGGPNGTMTEFDPNRIEFKDQPDWTNTAAITGMTVGVGNWDQWWAAVMFVESTVTAPWDWAGFNALPNRNDYWGWNGVVDSFKRHIAVGRNFPDGWTAFNGNIGDTAVYTVAKSTAERQALESAFAAKFGITFPVYTTISGKVTLPDGTTAVSGATVTATGTSLTVTNITGLDGTYSLSIEGNASYDVTAAKSSFSVAPASTNVAVASSAVTGVNFIMTPVYAIQGVVKNAGGTPIYNAVVQVGMGGPGPDYPAAVTDVNGHYLITGLNALPYLDSVEVYADAVGYADNTQYIDANAAATGTITLDITLTSKTEMGVIANGGLESWSGGLPTGWQFFNGTGVTASPSANKFSGTYSAFVTATEQYAFLMATVDVIPGSTYNCYFKLKGDVGVTQCFPMPAFRDAFNNELLALVSAEPGHSGYRHAAPTNAWLQYLHFEYQGLGMPFVRIPAPEGAAKMTVIFGFETLPPGGLGIYVDDVVIDRVGPDPALPPTPVLPPGAFTMSGGNPSLTFPTVAGYNYRVVYKNSLSDPEWLVVPPGFVYSTGENMTVTDETASGQPHRFYRVEAGMP